MIPREVLQALSCMVLLAVTVSVVSVAQPPKRSEIEADQAREAGKEREVKIMISIIDLDEVDTASQSFTASVFYLAQWNDLSLVPKVAEPTQVDLAKIWNPYLVFLNHQQIWKAFPESVQILPGGEVVYRQKVWARFSQRLDLTDFPFDRETLEVPIVAINSGARLTSFDPSEQKQSGVRAISAPDFEIVSSQSFPFSYSPAPGVRSVSGYEIQINVRRRHSYYVLKIIIPLCLIVVISWLPRWLDAETLGTNIGVSMTAFLTLVAYIFTVAALLPRVPYVTRMDRFLVGSVCLVFFGLLQTVGGATLIKRKPYLVRRVELRSRFVYPLLLVLVLAGSFLL